MQIEAIQYRGAEARKRAKEKLHVIVLWLARWAIADVHVIGQLLNLGAAASRKTAQQLITAGLVKRARFSNCTAGVLHLTQSGEALARRLLEAGPDAQISIPVFASRLRADTLAHDLLAQRVAMKLCNEFGFKPISARQIEFCGLGIGKDRRLSAGKIPDALLVRDGGNWALEMQESCEAKEVVERKLSQYAEAIERGELEGLIYASTSQSLLSRIEDVARGKVRRFWYNDQHEKWYPLSSDDKGDPLTEERLNDCFAFRTFTELARTYYPFHA